MKELSIEEKAKRYDEAIEKARCYYEGANGNEDMITMTTTMFPELKDEDEEIRKELINFFSDKNESDYEGLHPRTEIIAWLEKQGEKKYVDKVETKFKVGDWVVSPNGVYWHIDAIKNNRYEVSSTDGARADWPLNTNLYHLWNIQDVKVGDILVYDNGCVEIILLFKEWFRGACKASYNYAHIISSSHNIYINEWSDCGSSAHPATKLQRDTLIKAMSDAGYTFDFEKKELKKIEKASAEWSEEDINMIDWLIRCCEKEHEELCNDKYGHQDIVSDLKRDCRKKWDWLESLKNRVAPQKQWKPSDNELEVLRLAAEKDGTCLMGLYEQLKKLKG